MSWKALAALAIAAAAMLAGPAARAQQALYDPLPPKGSAYVRFFNALEQPLTVSPDFAQPLTLGTAGPQRVGPYSVVEHVEGRTVTVPMQAGGVPAKVALTLAPGTFNTVLWLPDKAGARGIVLRDESQFNELRTKLTFYNATTACASGALLVAPTGPAVFKDVPPASAAMRAVNPVEASVLADCAGRHSRPFDLKGLIEGGRFSLWLIMTAAGPQAFLARDVTTVWRR